VHSHLADHLEVHLDASAVCVVASDMSERGRIEIAAEQTIDVQKDVAIERCGDAEAIVVRGLEPCGVFTCVDADQQSATRCGDAVAPDICEERNSLVRREVAD